MENYIWEILKIIVLTYIFYIFILTFIITTFSYLTYRFWRMILPKEEKKIFISNAPMVWYKKT